MQEKGGGGGTAPSAPSPKSTYESCSQIKHAYDNKHGIQSQKCNTVNRFHF